MTDGAGKDEEVEDGVHVLPLVEGIEEGTDDVADAFGDNPSDGGGGDAVDEGFEGDEDAEAHADEAEGLEVGVLLESNEADDGASDGAEPDKGKKAPAPVALLAEGDKGQRRIGASNVPIDGGMVPLAEPLLPLGMVANGVVKGGGDVAAEHAKEVEDDPYPRPVVVGLEAPDEEDDAKDDTKQDAATVGRCVPDFLFLCIAYHSLSPSPFPVGRGASFFLIKVSPSRRGRMTCSVRGS